MGRGIGEKIFIVIRKWFKFRFAAGLGNTGCRRPWRGPYRARRSVLPMGFNRDAFAGDVLSHGAGNSPATAQFDGADTALPTSTPEAFHVPVDLRGQDFESDQFEVRTGRLGWNIRQGWFHFHRSVVRSSSTGESADQALIKELREGVTYALPRIPISQRGHTTPPAAWCQRDGRPFTPDLRSAVTRPAERGRRFPVNEIEAGQRGFALMDTFAWAATSIGIDSPPALQQTHSPSRGKRVIGESGFADKVFVPRLSFP